MYINYILEVYKVDTYTRNSTEFFCAKQYKFLLLTKYLVLSYNI